MIAGMTPAPGKGWDWFLPALSVPTPGESCSEKLFQPFGSSAVAFNLRNTALTYCLLLARATVLNILQEEGPQKQQRNDHIQAESASGFLWASYRFSAFLVVFLSGLCTTEGRAVGDSF